MNDFRFQNQQQDTRREWDLNNPDYLLIDKPARTSDIDRTLGVSSAQIFDGKN